ncbi:MAG: lysophospholipid acyltransferase family protein [Verrucomicrobia bacterium]|nr:lysophospholipid acyltransferase family protein [Verrucomicrobiota bacterium]
MSALPQIVMDAPGKAGPILPVLKGLVVPHQPKPLQRFMAWLVFAAERCVTGSLRCRWDDRSGLTTALSGQPVIFCIWHNRLAISMLVHRRYPRKLAALVSASKDGALLVAVLARFGVELVRGSSSRRGPQALLELTSRAELGYDLAVTPDGPRGPRYVVQKGIIALAQVTGLPIIPVTCNTRRKVCARSWDGFQIPLPFSRCELLLQEPIRVPREASETEREELRLELQRCLCASSAD